MVGEDDVYSRDGIRIDLRTENGNYQETKERKATA
jgi:hypothetical protein